MIDRVSVSLTNAGVADRDTGTGTEPKTKVEAPEEPEMVNIYGIMYTREQVDNDPELLAWEVNDRGRDLRACIKA